MPSRTTEQKVSYMRDLRGHRVNVRWGKRRGIKSDQRKARPPHRAYCSLCKLGFRGARVREQCELRASTLSCLDLLNMYVPNRLWKVVRMLRIISGKLHAFGSHLLTSYVPTSQWNAINSYILYFIAFLFLPTRSSRSSSMPTVMHPTI